MGEEFEVRILKFDEDWTAALRVFHPQVILYSRGSQNFLHRVLDWLSSVEEEVMALLPVKNGGIEIILPVLKEIKAQQVVSNKSSNLEKKASISEEAFRSAYENSLDGILLSRLDGTILAANSAACQMLEMTEEEICHAGRAGITDADDPDLLAVLNGIETEGKDRGEVTMIKKNGVRFPVELSSSVFKDDRGEAMTVVIFRDASVKFTNFRGTNNSLEDYQLLFSRGPFPYLIYDQQNLDIVEVNDLAVELYGYNQEEFRSLRITDIRPLEELNRLYEFLNKVRNEQDVMTHYNVYHQKKDGSRLKVHIYSFSVYYNDRDCRMAAIIEADDIENADKGVEDKFLKLAAAQEVGRTFIEKLVASEARYKGIVQSETNYVIRTDLEGNYTYHNKKFREDFGWMYPEEKIIGQHSMSSIKEYHHQAVIDLVERCIMAPGNIFQIELDKPNPKKGVRTTLWDFVCLLDSKGNPSEIQCVGIDISARVKAERRLKYSDLRYKLITEATSDAIWDWNLRTGRMLWFNRFKELFGYDPDECNTIRKWEALVHPDDRKRVSESLDEASRGTQTKWREEYRLKRKSGEYAYVIDQGSFLRDKNNKAYRAVGSLQDVTESKKLEHLLDFAINLSQIGSFELDLLKDELYWSPMTRTIHEVPKDFIVNLENSLSFYKEEKERKKVETILQQAIEEQRAFDEEVKICTAKDNEIWVRMIGQPEVVEGKSISITGSIQNIDKIKRAELEILSAAREKEILLDSIGDVFFAVDQEWKITYWNTHAARLLGLPKKTVIHQDFRRIFSEGLRIPFPEHYQDAMRDRKKKRFEAFYERTSAWYDVSVYPSGAGLAVFFRDITQRKFADAKLKELNRSLKAHTRELVTANKGLEQFSYIVSHNLRSPVANILGLSDLLKNGEYPDKIREKFFSEIFSNVERLDSVITDLNSILKTKAGTHAVNEEIDFHQLVEEIIQGIQHLIGKEQAQIICDFKNVPVINSVKSYMYSIFYNLIVNSIKYRKPEVHPVLEIQSRKKGDFVILSFRDNGLGMDIEEKEDEAFHLYKRFHHHVEGKGMGLFMVKTQVEMIGGKIKLESQVNKGTTFKIILKVKGKLTGEENEAYTLLHDRR